MQTDFLLIGLGLALLLAAGDVLVRGAVALSLRLGIPPLIVGLTVVAFGTSAPELLVSVQAALDGVPGIAIGNVVGSNIANVLIVLGVPALISALPATGASSRRSFYQMLAASVLLIGLCFAGPLHFWHAAVLLGALALMLLDAYREGRDGSVTGVDPQMPIWRLALFLVVGLVGLPMGAQLLVHGAVGVSRAFGLSEEVIGLTLIAVGTSLPELATTLMAAIRRHADVAMGNVIGSNLFNILAILGITSLFGPIPLDADFLRRDLWVMLVCALLLGPFVIGGRSIGRLWGGLFLLAYVGYTWVLLSDRSGAT